MSLIMLPRPSPLNTNLSTTMPAASWRMSSFFSLESEEISSGMVKQVGVLFLCSKPRAFMAAATTRDFKMSKKKSLSAR